MSLARDDIPEKAPITRTRMCRCFVTQTSPPTTPSRYDFHGLYHTHYDALAHHFFSDGKDVQRPSAQGFLHSGRRRDEATVINAKNGVFTRGVLMDMARLKGVPYLEPGTPMYAEDLEAWEKQAGIKVAAGDAVFIRTGRWVRRARLGADHVGNGQAGLDASVIPWVRAGNVALLASENALGPTPRPPRRPRLRLRTAMRFTTSSWWRWASP